MRVFEEQNFQTLDNALSTTFNSTFDQALSSTFDSAMTVPSMSSALFMLLMALVISMVVSAMIVLTQRWHGSYSYDNDVNGIQKVHKHPVPRTGGIALLAGLLMVPLVGMSTHAFGSQAMNDIGIFKLLLAAMPALLAGLYEDLTKKGSVRMRLIATFASAILAAWLLGASLPRLNIWGVDSLLHVIPISLAVTAFAVAGVTNSINIVDGFHGVAGGTVVVVLAGMGFLAWQAGDMFVTQLAFAGIGATLGFLMLNYPTGRLFMGDGGAYLLGFWVAEVAVLTIARNPEINAWQILAICAYPVIEVVFSMYRRKVVRKMCVGAPDRLHMHSLVYRRISCQKIRRTHGNLWMRNATVAWFVTAWIATVAVLAITFANTVPAAVALVLIQALAYMAIYTRLVRGHWCRCLNPAVLFGWQPERRVKSI